MHYALFSFFLYSTIFAGFLSVATPSHKSSFAGFLYRASVFHSSSRPFWINLCLTPTGMAELLPTSRRLFLLLLKLACFVFFPPAAPSANKPQGPARRAVSHSAATLCGEPSVSVRSYLRHLISFSRSCNDNKQQRQSPERREKLKQLWHYIVHPERIESEQDAVLVDAAGSAVKRRPSVTCSSCGVVFFVNRVELLELHQATKHAFSELPDGDPGNNIVRIIFLSGWKETASPPLIRRILKIHHSPTTLARFEECRDEVRNRHGGGGEAERCVVDGNERLRFYCATFLCRLDGKTTGTCGSPFCRLCWIIRQGFSRKEAAAEGGICTHVTARAAHSSLPEDLERQFAFLHVRRAMLICRVLAGRVRPRSLYGGTGSYDSTEGAKNELLVPDPRAALPCFVVIYD